MSDVQPVPPPVVVSPVTRNYSGWVAGSVVWALLLALYLFSLFAPPTEGLKADENAEGLLKTAMTHHIVAPKPKRDADPEQVKLQKTYTDLKGGVDKDGRAEMLYAEFSTYLGRPIEIGRLHLVAASQKASAKAFYKVYTEPKLSKADAATLIAAMPDRPVLYKLAKVQALVKSGQRAAASALLKPAKSPWRTAVGFAIMPFLICSGMIWVSIFGRYRDGTLKPLGLPTGVLSAHDADRLGIRALQIFGIYMVLGVVAEVVGYKLPASLSWTLNLGVGVLTIASIFWLQKAPIDGKRFRLAALGFTGENLVGHIWSGIIGFVASFPITMILAVISGVLLRWFPSPGHPATEALENSHDLKTVIPVLIFGSIIAPIWEEIVFRGMLFPALKKLLGMVPGMLLSSLVFASIHPQGIVMWLPLGFIGATSCYLSYQTRSLVPGIVMHMLNNTLTFIVVLLAS